MKFHLYFISIKSALNTSYQKHSPYSIRCPSHLQTCFLVLRLVVVMVIVKTQG